MIQTSPRFEACLPFILKEEGGKTNDPHDPGGRTNFGIIQREYDRYRRQKGLPLQSDYLIATDEVRDIYFHDYWLPHCPDLPAGLDLSFFDNCVNEGPREAVILLQRALAIPADGIWGDQTQTKVQNILDVRFVISAYSHYRERYYQSLRTFAYFGKGWLNRVRDIKTASLNMIGGKT